MWALLGIGASHLVVAPTLGATVGLFAIWVFVVVYAVKYGAWELGIRYSYATGENPVAAYSRLPGPNNWAVRLRLYDGNGCSRCEYSCVHGCTDRPVV